jgi:hypothetical protein
MKRFTSSLTNISSFGNERFLIPSYQRPYVWSDQQINKLLTDIWSAFDRNDEKYYLGTIVTALDGEAEELIDGQQRFTTLWLIALAFYKLDIPGELGLFLTVGDQVRLRFAIRSEVQEYLQNLLISGADSRAFDLPDTLLSEYPYLKGIAYAAKLIYRAIPQLRHADGRLPDTDGLGGFAGYIAQNVLFVKNTAPPKADLKKLFTTLNNSGIQLEQADILKSRLLDQLSANKLLYSRLWEACAYMENYFERNVQNSFSRTAKDLRQDQLSRFNSASFDEPSDGPDHMPEAISLSNILSGPVPAGNAKVLNNPDGREVVCESIIDFPQLLLHTLRLYLQREQQADFDQPFQAGHLLEIFEPLCAAGETAVIKFLECLWEIRFVFDLYVIKWVEKDGERILGLRGLNGELQRDPVSDRTTTVMLQSMLYFTGNYNTQMWLTAWLYELLAGRSDIRQLEQIDNGLSLTAVPDKRATWEWITTGQISPDQHYRNYLQERNGTRFRHYWFYKLEYILWKNWNNRQDSRFVNYRITSKNSVEHIFPQQEEFGGALLDEIGKPFGDSFANLTLLSVGQNSSYGNQATGKKRIDFEKKNTYDSLKLARFFQVCGDTPDYAKAVKHYDEMLGALDQHYAKPLEPAVLVAILNS